jgi:hypothetical protein
MTDPTRPEDAEELDADELKATSAADSDAPDLDEATAEEADAAGEADLDAEAEADLDVEGEGEGGDAEAVSVANEPVLAADDAAPTRPMSSRERRAAKAAGKTTPVAGPDDLPYVDDRVSKWWVGLIALTFLLIIAYGFIFGRGGFLTPAPTPVPSEPAVLDTPTPAAPTSASPSITIAPSGTPALSASPRTSAAPTSTVPASALPSGCATPPAGASPGGSLPSPGC